MICKFRKFLKFIGNSWFHPGSFMGTSPYQGVGGGLGKWVIENVILKTLFLSVFDFFLENSQFFIFFLEFESF